MSGRRILCGPGFWVGLLFLVAAAGCVNLDPAEERVRYFVLTPVRTHAAGGGPVRTGDAVGWGGVTVASYLDQRSIIERTAGGEIRRDPDLQWAEPLADGLGRVLRANLAGTLPGLEFVERPWRAGTVIRSVEVIVERLDVDERGVVVLEARWRVRDGGTDGAVRAADAVRLRREGPRLGDDPGGVVAGMDALLADLADRVAASGGLGDR